MPRVQINSSRHGTQGEVVAVEDGQVVWTGPIKALAEAGSFDALFCHDDDEGLARFFNYKIAPSEGSARVKQTLREAGADHIAMATSAIE